MVDQHQLLHDGLVSKEDFQKALTVPSIRELVPVVEVRVEDHIVHDFPVDQHLKHGVFLIVITVCLLVLGIEEAIFLVIDLDVVQGHVESLELFLVLNVELGQVVVLQADNVARLQKSVQKRVCSGFQIVDSLNEQGGSFGPGACSSLRRVPGTHHLSHHY